MGSSAKLKEEPLISNSGFDIGKLIRDKGKLKREEYIKIFDGVRFPALSTAH